MTRLLTPLVPLLLCACLEEEVVAGYAKAHRLEGLHTPQVPHIETLRELAVSRAGYALLPAYTTHRDQEIGRLRVFPAEGLDTDLRVSIVGRKNQLLTPALEAARLALLGLRVQLERP